MGQLDRVQQGWRNFVLAALNRDYPDTSVVFANENGPRPRKPYLTLKLSNIGRVTISDSLKYNKKRDKYDLVGHRRYNLSVQSFGLEFIDVLDDLISSTDDPDLYEILRKCDIGVENKGTPIDVSTGFANNIEGRGSLDISFITSKIKNTNIGTIESVEISGEANTETETKEIDIFKISKP